MVNTATPAFNPLFHCNFRWFCSTPGRPSPGCKRAYPIGQPLAQQGRVHTKAHRYVPQTYMRCRAHDLVVPEANRIPVPPRPPGAPFAASGPNSPFWAVVPMLAAAVEAEAVMGDAPAFAVGEAAASAGADDE